MKKLINLSLLLIAFSSVMAQKISVSELEKMKKDPNTVIVDTRAASDYSKTHIKGAINIDVEALNNKTPIEGILKSSKTVASALGKHGLSPSKNIVLYCKTGVRAGRMYWVLKYLGAPNVYMLDGQLDAWFAARKPITKTPTTLPAATFTPKVNSKIKADKAYVKSKLNDANAVIVDTRKPAEFDAGHIENAVNINHETMLSGKKLKSIADLTAIFNKAGVTKNKEVILYCKTSATAGLTYFILDALLKYPNLKVYDGAWMEWSK